MRSGTSMIAVVVMAALTMLVVPGGALADHSTAIQPFAAGGSTITVAGCQAKGLRASAAPKSSGTGLAPATYLYTVTAVLAGGDTPACAPLAVTTGVGNDSGILQWNTVPGALGYRVYRSDSTASPATLRALLISAGNTMLPSQASPGGPPCPSSGRGDKCVFQDNGGLQDAAQQPALITDTTQGGAHADVNLVQTIDYGSDAFDPDMASTTASLRTDLFRHPPGFGLNPGAAPVCKLSGAAPSLIGDPAKFGSDDPDEDTCLTSSLVGTVQAVAVTPSGTAVTEGDVYMGAVKAGELARVFMVLRPLCSAGSLFGAPGSASCNASLGGANRQVEKAFVAGVVRTVDRGGGVIGLDVDTVQAEDDGPIAPFLNVLVPTPALIRAGKNRLSVRQLNLHLFGVADQNTASTAGDQPFTTLPVLCGAQAFAAQITTYTDAAAAIGSAPFSPSPCELAPVTPQPAAPAAAPAVPGVDAVPPATVAVPGAVAKPPAFGTATLVTIKLAARRIPGRGPLRILVANANAFAVTGVLAGETVSKVTFARKQRIALKTKAFSVAAHATKSVNLALPGTLRRQLVHKHRLALRLAVKVKDPAGNTRTVKARVSPLLKAK